MVLTVIKQLFHEFLILYKIVLVLFVTCNNQNLITFLISHFWIYHTVKNESSLWQNFTFKTLFTPRDRPSTTYRSSRSEVFCEKDVLEISQNSQENTCTRVSFLISCRPQVCNFIKKGTLAQVFSCEFCEISKNISGGCFCTYTKLLKKLKFLNTWYEYVLFIWTVESRKDSRN